MPSAHVWSGWFLQNTMVRMLNGMVKWYKLIRMDNIPSYIKLERLTEILCLKWQISVTSIESVQQMQSSERMLKQPQVVVKLKGILSWLFDTKLLKVGSE